MLIRVLAGFAVEGNEKLAKLLSDPRRGTTRNVFAALVLKDDGSWTIDALVTALGGPGAKTVREDLSRLRGALGEPDVPPGIKRDVLRAVKTGHTTMPFQLNLRREEIDLWRWRGHVRTARYLRDADPQDIDGSLTEFAAAEAVWQGSEQANVGLVPTRLRTSTFLETRRPAFDGERRAVRCEQLLLLLKQGRESEALEFVSTWAERDSEGSWRWRSLEDGGISVARVEGLLEDSTASYSLSAATVVSNVTDPAGTGNNGSIEAEAEASQINNTTAAVGEPRGPTTTVPPQKTRKRLVFHVVLVMSLMVVVLLSGRSYWPGGNGSSRCASAAGGAESSYTASSDHVHFIPPGAFVDQRFTASSAGIQQLTVIIGRENTPDDALAGTVRLQILGPKDWLQAEGRAEVVNNRHTSVRFDPPAKVTHGTEYRFRATNESATLLGFYFSARDECPGETYISSERDQPGAHTHPHDLAGTAVGAGT